MNYEFHPEAERDLFEAALRYESEVPELGGRFVNEVERVIGLLLEHPKMGARIDENLRHFVLRKFPF
jgi:plasmid stabilization system protein ParE